MKVLRMALGAAVLSALVGCTSFDYDGEEFEANEGRVIVFNVTQAPTPSMWRTIGTAEISRPVRLSSEQGLIYTLRTEAGERGADAIHLLSIATLSDGEAVDETDGTPWCARRTIKAELLRHIPINDHTSPESIQARGQMETAPAMQTADPAPAAAEIPAETPAEPAQ